MVYLILSIILFILLFLLFLPLKIIVSVQGKKIVLKVKLVGITVFKFSPGKNKKNTEKSAKATEDKVKNLDEKSQTLSEKIKFYAELSKLAARLAKKLILIEYISVKIEVGTSDAASTAVCTGILWGTIYRILGALGSIIYIQKNSVNVKPDFDKTKFSAKGKCIIKSRLAYIIFIALVIIIKIKSLKGKED